MKEETVKQKEFEKENEKEGNAFDDAVKAEVYEVFKELRDKIESLSAVVSELSENQNGNTANPGLELNGAVTGETGRESPDKRVDFSKLSYSELCSFLERHPKSKL